MSRFRRHLITTLLLLLSTQNTHAEYRTYNKITLSSDSTFISYAEGYIIAPGSLNVRDLSFESAYSYENKLRNDGQRHASIRVVSLDREEENDDNNNNDNEFIDMGDMIDFEDNVAQVLLLEGDIEAGAPFTGRFSVQGDDDNLGSTTKFTYDLLSEGEFECTGDDCAVHIHKGTDCDKTRKHYYNKELFEEDPWSVGKSTYTITEGFGRGEFNFDNGYYLADNNGHAVVFHYTDEHGDAGTACGVLLLAEKKNVSEEAGNEGGNEDEEQGELDLGSPVTSAAAAVSPSPSVVEITPIVINEGDGDGDEGENDAIEIPTMSPSVMRVVAGNNVTATAAPSVALSSKGTETPDEEYVEGTSPTSSTVPVQSPSVVNAHDTNSTTTTSQSPAVAGPTIGSSDAPVAGDDGSLQSVSPTHAPTFEAIDDDAVKDEIVDLIGDDGESGSHDHHEEDETDDDLDSGSTLPSSSNAVELAFFTEPEECSKTRDGCDWTALGIGASNAAGDVRWCCKEDAMALDLCNTSQYGKLILDQSVYKGAYLSVHVPKAGIGDVGVDGLMKTQESGNHILVIANCGFGEDILVSGSSIWESDHGYLPGDLWGEFEFFIALACLYFAILCWYGWKMHVLSDFTIPIQKWILVTLLIGFIEVFFKVGDYWIWNEDGVRHNLAMYIGIIAGVMKRAVSRALILMVSLGWGVVRDTLGGKLRRITLFCILYAVSSGARDLFTTLAITDPDLNTQEEKEVINVIAICTFTTAALDVTVYLWILDSINATIEHLENMSQYQKLKIMLRLRLFLIMSILFAIVWSIFGLVNVYMDNRMLSLEQEWAVKGAWELNYLFVLFGVSILWRPNERAKEFAFAMELPASGDLNEVEFDTNAGLQQDDDDEDCWGGNGHDFSNEFSLEDDADGFVMGEYGNGLRIEDGEHA